MKRTPWIVGSFCLATLAACNGNRDNNAGATRSGTESGSMQGGAAGTATDTGVSPGGGGAVGDTAPVRSDSATRPGAKGNQTKSGVTNTKTGESTLGKGVTTTRPDQNQPVTSKGDTIRQGNDTTAAGPQ
jgi:hypothetical protein